jgi:glutamine synthetase adenylyltransferase
VISKYNGLLDQSPNPELASLRLERLLQEDAVSNVLREKPAEFTQVFIDIITVSNFLFHYLCREPEAIYLIGSEQSELVHISKVSDIQGLRLLKYRELLRITSLDIYNQIPYEQILLALSELADEILNKMLELIVADQELKWADKEVPLAMFAMGKCRCTGTEL